MKRLAICFLLLATCPLAAQEIVITGLERPFNPPNFAVIRVSGIEDAELAKASVQLVPNDPQIIIERSGSIPKAWIVLIGQDALPGSRQFTVSLNAFRKHLDEAARNTAGMDPADSKALIELSSSLGKKYPYRFGSAVLEVAGPRPPPVPPVPPIPPGPSRGLVTTIVIRVVDSLTADQSEVLSNLRQWSDQQPHDKVAHLEFPPDAKDPFGSLDAKVAGWVKQIPATAKQPYVFVTQPISDGKSIVVWKGELPKTADELIAKIKERM